MATDSTFLQHYCTRAVLSDFSNGKSHYMTWVIKHNVS